MRTLYNEIDRYCCDWLQNLMDAGEITPGKIDGRNIRELTPDDVCGFDRVHFFAGIGGWDLALNLAGWGFRPVWTGSCPCQPFSAAGKGKAADDERHLWPAWLPLIAQCRPPIVFGEQVEAAIGWGWLDAVFADLEAEGYACGAAVLPACGVGAPHIRQRCWFVADTSSGSVSLAGRRSSGREGSGRTGTVADDDARGRPVERAPRLHDRGQSGNDAAGRGANGDMGDMCSEGLQKRERDGRVQREALGPQPRQALVGGGDACEPVADAGREPAGRAGCGETESGRPLGHATGCGAWGDFWADLEWLPCTDGKARPTKPGLFPLAHGVPARVGKLRAAGNAIVPQVAAAFIGAVM